MDILARVVLLLAMAVAGPAQAAPVEVDPAFGYRIGDHVVAVGRVAVDERAQLDPQSLPKTGRVNGWLALLDVAVEAAPGMRQVVRTFQVTASAPEPKMLFLPKAELAFRLDGREWTESLDSVPISVSPLTSAEPITRNGFGALRPDRDVPDPDPRKALRRAGWLALALLALAVLWVAIRFLAMRRRGFAPFAVAARQLRRLARQQSRRASESVEPAIGAAKDGPAESADRDDVRQAFRVMHDALNEVSGKAVFVAHLDRFLAEQPRFAPEASAIRAFFARSDAVFFGGPAAATAGSGSSDRTPRDSDLAWLADLARRLARLERPGR